MKRVFEFWIVAGPNGAGKTTCVQAEPIRNIVPDVRFLNPDDLTRALLLSQGYAGFSQVAEPELKAAFIRSANEVETEVANAIARRESVGVETVLSTDKYRSFVDAALGNGANFNLIYVTLASSEIAIQRVAMRVARGGHDVPADKINDRFRRSHANLPWFAAKAHHFWVIDNSGSEPNIPPVLCAYGAFGRIDHLAPDSPQHLIDTLSVLKVA